MKRVVCSLTLIVFVATMLYAQPNPDTLWTQHYQYTNWIFGSDVAFSICQTSDNGYIISGSTQSSTAYHSEIYLLKIDSNGEILWERIFGGPWHDWATSILQTADLGYIFTGMCAVAETDGDLCLAKLDSQGDTLWVRMFGGIERDEGEEVQITTDGGYIVAGWAWSFGAGNSDCYVVKTFSDGSLDWAQTYGSPDNEYAQSIEQTSDGGYIIAGVTGFYINYDYYVIKINSHGNVIWDSTYGGSGSDMAYSVIQTNDGGYIIAGHSNSFSTSGTWECYVVKIDSIGQPQWTRTIGQELADFRVYTIQQTDEGNYMVAGEVEYLYPSDVDYFLAKLDSTGDTLWTRTYGGFDMQRAYVGIQTTDGGYILAGEDFYYDAEGDVYVVKTGPDQYQMPYIVVSDDSLDFGFVLLEQPEELSLTIYNIGDTTLVLNDIYASQHCFGTWWNPADSLVNPGDSLVITVFFSPDDSIFYEETLTIENNDHLVEVQLRGYGVCTGASLRKFSKPPGTYVLRGVYPNPFNAMTMMSYDVPMVGAVQISVYDVLGKKVATLIDEEAGVGRYQVVWDAGDLPSGVYFVQMEAGDFRQVRKVVLLK